MQFIVTNDHRLRTVGLAEAGFHELSIRFVPSREDAARDLLMRLAGIQVADDVAIEAGEEIVDGGRTFRTRHDVDGTLEIVDATH